MTVASRPLCKELYETSGWESALLDYWVSDRHHEYGVWDKAAISDRLTTNDKILFPAYGLGYLLDKALAVGHQSIKFKQSDKGVIVTAPPCYHIEAKTPADALAKLLIRSVKKGVVNA